MAQFYAQAHLDALDERFSLEAKTDVAVNKDGLRIDWNGKNAVTIYNVDTVAETDYVRSGFNRFGPMLELGTGEQTLTLSQDKAFTFSVDRGNLKDSMMAQEVGKAVKRQVREVSIPNTDIYRIGVWSAYALANSQGVAAGTASTNSTAYANLLTEQAALDNAKVPEEGRIAFVTPGFYNLLKRDSEFMRDCDTAYKDVKRGILGEVDGLTLVKMPSSYFVSKTEFLIVHKSITVSPMKFNSVRTLSDVQGIDGWVAEGRRYYDSFILGQKGVAVRLRTHA